MLEAYTELQHHEPVHVDVGSRLSNFLSMGLPAGFAIHLEIRKDVISSCKKRSIWAMRAVMVGKQSVRSKKIFHNGQQPEKETKRQEGKIVIHSRVCFVQQGEKQD